MKYLKAFTLSEIMIAITVLGLICAAVMPAILSNNPSQNKAMIKRAYYNFSDIISTFINDENLYPLDDGKCYNSSKELVGEGYVGLDCDGQSSKLPWNFTQIVNMDKRVTETQAAFATSASYSKSDATACMGVANPCYYLKTADGMIWTFPKNTTFTVGDKDSYIMIGVDVNGDKKPNCYEGNSSDTCKNREKDFDQFRMKLYADGKMEVIDDWASEAIDISTNLLGS